MLQFMVKGDFNEHTDIWNKKCNDTKKRNDFSKNEVLSISSLT